MTESITVWDQAWPKPEGVRVVYILGNFYLVPLDVKLGWQLHEESWVMASEHEVTLTLMVEVRLLGADGTDVLPPFMKELSCLFFDHRPLGELCPDGNFSALLAPHIKKVRGVCGGCLEKMVGNHRIWEPKLDRMMPTNGIRITPTKKEPGRAVAR